MTLGRLVGFYEGDEHSGHSTGGAIYRVRKYFRTIAIEQFHVQSPRLVVRAIAATADLSPHPPSDHVRLDVVFTIGRCSQFVRWHVKYFEVQSKFIEQIDLDVFKLLQ